MSGINKAIILGRLGDDPIVRYAASGECVTSFSLATSETWKDKQGQKQEKTEWHKVVIWGKLAEIAEKFVKKGSQIYIEGQLQTRKWQDKDGNERYTTEIVLQGFNANLILLSSKNNNSQESFNDFEDEILL